MLPLWIIKLGSAVTRAENGGLAVDRLQSLVEQCVNLQSDNVAEFALVSSGAVSAGRSLLQGPASDDAVIDRQVCAALGQTELVNFYRDAFAHHDQRVAQVLATREDFATRRHYLNMRACLQALLQRGIVPVINENDVVAVTELMFTDNDELAALVAGMLGAERLILLSDVDGVYAGEPGSSAVIAEWTGNQNPAARPAGIRPGTDPGFGRGGINSKIENAQRAAALGSESWIANGLLPDVLRKISAGNPIGTRFPAAARPSEAKRWVGTAPHRKATVTVNAGAAKILCDAKQLASLLPVGIVNLSGEFDRGDIVRIEDENSQLIGFGRAEYDDKQAGAVLGLQQQKPLVHYNYLHVIEYD